MCELVKMVKKRKILTLPSYSICSKGLSTSKQSLFLQYICFVKKKEMKEALLAG